MTDCTENCNIANNIKNNQQKYSKLTHEEVIIKTKLLREKTGAATMECQEAIEASDGIEELAIWYLNHRPQHYFCRSKNDNTYNEFLKDFKRYKDRFSLLLGVVSFD